MTRRSLAVLLFVLGGCSVLFDPSKAPPRCPATPPANPESVVATVGATGVIEWTWPDVEPAATYRFCTSVVGGTEQCRSIAPADACAMGSCRVRDESQAIGVRVSARVQSVDECALEGATANAPTTSATPISTTTMEGWVLQNSCAATTANIAGGLLSIEQSGFLCTTSFVTGDELWGDFTIDADVRVSQVGGDNIAAGLALHSNATGHRLLATAFNPGNGGTDPAQLRSRDGTQERVVATSIRPLLENGFTHFRITSRQGVISWQLGTAEAPVEIIRWPDSSAHAGRLGIAAYGTGRIEVQNFVVKSSAVLGPPGPSTFSLDLADGGFATKTRLRGVSTLSVVPCPAYADNCGGSCAPPAGASCARFERVGLGYTLLGFDLPTGLDPRRPWDLSMRFATQPDAGNALVLDSSQGITLLLSPNDATGLDSVYLRDGGLPDGKWHTAAWRFEPDAGRFDLRLDGQLATPTKTAFPPADRGRFLGAFTMGNFFNNREFYVSDVQVTQAP